MENQIEKLPSFFTRKGMEYRKRLENEDWYIYGIRPEKSHADFYFEVFRKTTRPKRTYDKELGWQTIEGVLTEAYPSDESFGSWAFSVTTLERAMKYSGSDGLLDI